MNIEALNKRSFFHRNGLCVVFLTLTAVSLWGEMYFGFKEHNKFLQEQAAPSIAFITYLGSGHFIQATFENWESEFLQMGLFVVLTIFLYQKGSSESKLPEEPGKDKEDELTPKKDSPWPVKKKGFALALYKHSLSLALFLLFILSFALHWYGSWIDFNEKQRLQRETTKDFVAYLSDTRFWFESFQNWQSEFLSVFAIIFLSIYLRQVGSPQSKPVNAAHEKTGE